MFHEIKAQTAISPTIPDSIDCPGFDVDFDLDGVPRVRYLGRFDNETSKQDLLDIVPVQPEAVNLDAMALPMFRRKLRCAIEASKADKQAERDKKRSTRVELKRSWLTLLRRSQCYLGVRVRVPADVDKITADPNVTWEESQQLSRDFDRAMGIERSVLNLQAPVPYPFFMDAVIVCFDIEAYEFSHSRLTEFGFATLDTRDLLSVAPGSKGRGWWDKARYRHLRVVEYAHLKNGVHVAGCPDNFCFGESEWISLQEIPQAVASCFRQPYSKPGAYQRYPSDKRQVPRGGSHVEPLIDVATAEPRNLILLGHDLKSDITMLKNVGYNVANLGNVVEVIDTTSLYRTWRRDTNMSKLSRVLQDLDIDAWHLHNAVGNTSGIGTEQC